MIFSTRIAPTPSGYLHIGNVYSFLITWLIARQRQGTLSLRIDDLDELRLKKPYVEDIFETLQFMQIDYDAGPKNTEAFFTGHSQQFRLNNYHRLLAKLAATGQVYACTCSRKTLQALSDEGRYHEECRHKKLPLDTPGAAWRLYVPAGTIITFTDEYKGVQVIDLGATMGDFIIKRKDGIPSYQVASLADDTFYHINFIVRGEDLLCSTAAQLYLAGISGDRAFTQTHFFHHPLITTGTGDKLAKSAGSQSIKQLRESGYKREDILQMLVPAMELITRSGVLKPANTCF
jgi:glutamyl-tRNA synthetase